MSVTETCVTGAVDDAAKLGAVVSAMTSMRDDMRAMSQSAHRVVTQGTVAISAAVGILFAQNLFKDDLAFACIGVAIALVMFFLLVVALAMHSRYAIDQVHLAALERKANSLVGEPLLMTHQPETRGENWYDGDFRFTFVVITISLVAHVGLLWFVGVRGYVWLALSMVVIELGLSIFLIRGYLGIVSQTERQFAAAYGQAAE